MTCNILPFPIAATELPPAAPAVPAARSTSAPAPAPAPAGRDPKAAARKRTLVELRELLAEKFPGQQPLSPPPSHWHSASAGAAAGKPGRDAGNIGPAGTARRIDVCAGGIRQGVITEATGSLSSGSLFLDSLLQRNHRARRFAALVDGCGCFDPQSCGGGQAELDRLLWVWCDGVTEAVKATDLLLRDGNLPLVILDLQMAPLAELRRGVPASTWHRFARIGEQSRTTALVVLTSQPVIEAARVRIALESPPVSLRAMRRRRDELAQDLSATLHRRGGGGASMSMSMSMSMHGDNPHSGERFKIA